MKGIKEILFDRKLKKNGIELLKISDLVIDLYKKQVRDNLESPREQMFLKINRNWMLGRIVKDRVDVQIRRYGNLEITYSKIENKIVGIWNIKSPEKQYGINRKERDRLTKLLGIKDDKKVGVA